MLDMDSAKKPKQVWDRLERESERAFKAFESYLNLPSGERSVLLFQYSSLYASLYKRFDVNSLQTQVLIAASQISPSQEGARRAHSARASLTASATARVRLGASEDG